MTIDERVANLEARLDDIDARLDALEDRPCVDVRPVELLGARLSQQVSNLQRDLEDERYARERAERRSR